MTPGVRIAPVPLVDPVMPVNPMAVKNFSMTAGMVGTVGTMVGPVGVVGLNPRRGGETTRREEGGNRQRHSDFLHGHLIGGSFLGFFKNKRRSTPFLFLRQNQVQKDS